MNAGGMVRLALASVLAAALFDAQAIDAEEGAHAVFRRVAPSVATVLALNEQGQEEGLGSGVVVGVERIVTNCHVVRDARGLKVRNAQGELPATWIVADPSRDLCLLSVAGLQAPPVRSRSHKDLSVGERVFAVGNPLGFGLSVSEGLVSMLTQVRGEPVIIGSAAQSPGSSGGGLFDAEGRLVGITTSVMGIGQNLNLILPADWIGELTSRGVAAKPPPPTPEPEPRWADEAEALRVKRDWSALEALAAKWLAAHPNSSWAGQSLGLALFNLNRKSEAEQVLRATVRNDERNAHAWNYLAMALHSTGKKDEAEQAIARATRLLPDNAFSLQLRSDLLQSEGRLDDAQALIERAIASGPGEPGRWIELAKIETARNRGEAAIRALRAALRLDPGNAQVQTALAVALARAGKSDKAHELLGANGSAEGATSWIEIGVSDLAANRFSDAERALRKAIAIAPDNHLAWFNLGVVLRRTGRTPQAEEAFERSLTLKPDFAHALIARSESQFKRGDISGAIASQRQAVATDPANADAWRVLAGLLYESRTFTEAAVAYRKLVELGKSNAADLASLGDCLLRSGQAEQARDTLQQAEKLAPNDTGVLLGLASLHGHTGDNKRSIEYATRAADNDPGNVRAWSSKGYALLVGGRFAEAVAALQTAVGLDPASSNAWINLGHAHLRNREAGKAIFALQKALNVAPQAVDAHLYLAQAYIGTRQTAKAREEAEAVLFRVPDLPAALAVLTLSHAIDGRKDEAAASYQRLKAKNPIAARALRTNAIANGISSAITLPE